MTLANIQLIKNMKTIRNKFGYTQEVLAKKLNISRQAYSNYENYKREPDLNFIIQFAQKFDLTLDQLVLQNISPYEDVIREQSGPYIAAIQDDSSKTLHLSEAEIEMILKYRSLPDDDRRLVDKVLNSVQ